MIQDEVFVWIRLSGRGRRADRRNVERRPNCDDEIVFDWDPILIYLEAMLLQYEQCGIKLQIIHATCLLRLQYRVQNSLENQNNQAVTSDDASPTAETYLSAQLPTFRLFSSLLPISIRSTTDRSIFLVYSTQIMQTNEDTFAHQAQNSTNMPRGECDA